ncbi:MAG: ATP-binding domain-containing protein [Candidatus Marsarchaeota archaeon]|nr:ATP-binding domain-containing protein [Candidatus Marsarchaeota archaeon]
MLVSCTTGLVIFNLVEGDDLGPFRELQDDSANKMEAKLRGYRRLMKGRILQVTPQVVTFAPARDSLANRSEEAYPVCNESSLQKWLDDREGLDPSYFAALVAVIQAISTIRTGRKKREVRQEDSRGAKLKALEDSIANLDNWQGRAVLETVDNVQRIRGLAGSGKTIVLALKAAYLHAQHPDWKIAVTFNTRSLKGQFRQLINTFVIEQTNEEPDWDNLQIIHAWGAPGGGDRDGLYYTFCQLHGLECMDFAGARSRFPKGREFDGSCEKALAGMRQSVGVYDAILVDEAQDFPPSFLNLCYELLKSEKRLVYAYDELQNLGSQSLPSPEEIFRKNPDGTPRVRFVAPEPGKPRQDIILSKCYRNSRPVLVTAHALGFGVYRKPNQLSIGALEQHGTGLLQMFDRKELWLDVGYSVAAGRLEDGDNVVLQRTDESSPSFLENHSSTDDLIQFVTFNSEEAQIEWVVAEIEKNLRQDELRHDDIVVINPDPVTTRNAVAPIRRLLFEHGVNSHLAGVDTSPDVFFSAETESVTFTGIYRAKGNEAGMVYVINAQDCFSSVFNPAGVRNRLFTAITRSKAWVRVVGVGPAMKRLEAEFDEVRKNQFTLAFRYPTAEERQHLNVVNRDMTDDERRRVERGKSELASLLEDLETGKVYLEDLGADQVARLRALLGKG